MEVAAVAELLGIMGADNVFVVEPGGRFDLAQEARQRVGAVQLRLVDHLHRNVSLHEPMFRQVDCAHASAAQLADDAQPGVMRQFGGQAS